jgi:hypothetical protein
VKETQRGELKEEDERKKDERATRRGEIVKRQANERVKSEAVLICS